MTVEKSPAIHIPSEWKISDRLATPESAFLNRRQLLRAMGWTGAAMALPRWAGAAPAADPAKKLQPAIGGLYADRFPVERNQAYGLGDRKITDEDVAGSYSNFYEFTTAKEKVWELAQGYQVTPWKIKVGGLVKEKRELDLDDIFTRFPLEERLYRFRCVERWAMQVPWTGFPLKTLIDWLEPLPSARWVRLVSVLDKQGLPGQRSQGWYSWPYHEALRLDEATHPLAFVAVGSYGHALPMQHGAPWRLALPWKYGFKGPKSIVQIEFTKRRPQTFWNSLQPAEYGFFSNVDPRQPHPRWSQRWEKDIGTGETRETLSYNGYAEQVGGLYDGSET